MRAVKTINIILILLVIILAINLIYPLNSVTGDMIYNLDMSSPKCYFQNVDELGEISDINRCCYELQKQLNCKKIDSENFDLYCYISESSDYSYLINYKIFNYCKKEGYDVKIK
ncbi:MAG: hypothetical protein IB618_00295 [Candidatus Pacearchaeota archaeon]|nr:MAG: hypothetical protein IB618_00295 [Candidatus Pacearchaeota archaeon]